MNSDDCDYVVTDFDEKNTDRVMKGESCDSELVEETTHSVEEDSSSNRNREYSPAQGPTLPILQKIICLSTKIQNLKKDHARLVDQVKGISSDSYPGPEVLDALRTLSGEHELLKKKYLDESTERKRLYNEVIELKGNIRVFCRCRPLNQADIANGSASVVEFDSSQENELQIISSDSSKKHFKFDHVFKPEDHQEVVFAQTKPIVTSVLDGYNVCIFAYGQTGTGKTFTMEGTPENRGVNFRTLEELFRISKERTGVMRYELFVSMLEVYNEKIRDLLVENFNQPPKKLDVKQGAEGTQEVPGLIEAGVHSTEEVWDLLKAGGKARSVGSTNANEQSSRSHCLLRVTVKGENAINGQKTRSHLWLVDLAGSERVGKIEVEGERLKESQFINKSLSALGDVISALASKSSHIPYRNSKLTHMLQSSLGGDCKTLMFVQISPSASDLGETLCSLNFASRVRGIESGPARKQADLTELFKYKQIAEKLKHDEKETKKLQDNLQSLQLRLAAREHICRSFQEKVRDLENQLAEERKTRIKQETRAFAATSNNHQSLTVLSTNTKQGTKTEKKPPLAPSKMRMPLRRITNFMPPPPSQTQKPTKIHKPVMHNNNARSEDHHHHNKENTKSSSLLMKPRRYSVAVRAPPPHSTTNSSSSSQVLQPRRRVSIATLRPEPSSHMATPQNTSAAFGRQSFVRDSRKARYSKLFSPLSELKNSNNAYNNASSSEVSTPMATMKSSSKFMGSPPTAQVGSWRPKHPTVLALQKKTLVWSPLKMRGVKSNQNSRRSLIPSSYSQHSTGLL